MYNGYDTEEEYLRSLKQDDSYHFSIEFEYIEKNYGNDEYDVGTATMEVDAEWDDSQAGYVVSYYCPDFGNIDASEGNPSSEKQLFEEMIELDVYDRLEDCGVPAQAIIM